MSRLALSAAKPTDAASVSDSSDPRTTTTHHHQSVLTTIYSHRICKFMSSQTRVLAAICYYIPELYVPTARCSPRHDYAHPTYLCSLSYSDNG